MDDLDHRLIAQLRANGRAPISDLAKRLDVSRATVRSRIDRLVADGVIQGFTVLLKDGAERPAVRAIMFVEVQGQAADKVVDHLRGLPQVTTIYTTNGRWDIVVELEVETLEAFDESLRRIRLVPGIAGTQTSILLATRKSRVTTP